MCRWLAYSGSSLLVEELLFKPKHSLIDQSLHSTMGAEATNGDGFGIGWYGTQPTPGTFHSVEPSIDGYSSGSTARTSSRFTRWKSPRAPLCIHSQFP